MKILSLIFMVLLLTVFVNGQRKESEKELQNIQSRNDKLGIEKLQKTLSAQEQEAVILQEMLLLKQRDVVSKLETIIKLMIEVEDENKEIKVIAEQLNKQKEILRLMTSFLMSSPLPL